jgi:hypothetical protein
MKEQLNLDERANQLRASLAALQLSLSNQSRLLYLVEACRENPIQDNLDVLAAEDKRQLDFIKSITESVLTKRT